MGTIVDHILAKSPESVEAFDVVHCLAPKDIQKHVEDVFEEAEELSKYLAKMHNKESSKYPDILLAALSLYLVVPSVKTHGTQAPAVLKVMLPYLVNLLSFYVLITTTLVIEDTVNSQGSAEGTHGEAKDQ